MGLKCGSSANEYSTIIYRLNKSHTDKFFIEDFGIINVTECSLNWGDLNNDGWEDLIVAGRYGTESNNFTTKIYININGTSFNNTQNLTRIKLGYTLL